MSSIISCLSVLSKIIHDTSGTVKKKHKEPCPASVQQQVQCMGMIHSPQKKATQQIFQLTTCLVFQGNRLGSVSLEMEIKGATLGIFLLCKDQQLIKSFWRSKNLGHQAAGEEGGSEGWNCLLVFYDHITGNKYVFNKSLLISGQQLLH